MAFTVVHRDGTRTQDPPLPAVEELLGELEADGDVVEVCHQAGWALAIYGDGVVEFLHHRSPEVPVRHSSKVPPELVGELAQAVAVGSFYETLEHEWANGPRRADA